MNYLKDTENDIWEERIQLTVDNHLTTSSQISKVFSLNRDEKEVRTIPHICVHTKRGYDKSVRGMTYDPSRTIINFFVNKNVINTERLNPLEIVYRHHIRNLRENIRYPLLSMLNPCASMKLHVVMRLP
jgi:hypothetical protein